VSRVGLVPLANQESKLCFLRGSEPIGSPKHSTVYGLYRPGTELRGVYYAKPEVAGAACNSMGDQCDYPILLGANHLVAINVHY